MNPHKEGTPEYYQWERENQNKETEANRESWDNPIQKPSPNTGETPSNIQNSTTPTFSSTSGTYNQYGRPANPYPAGSMLAESWDAQNASAIAAWDTYNSDKKNKDVANYFWQNTTNPIKQQATLTQSSNLKPYMSLSNDPNKNLWETGTGGLYDPNSGKVNKPSDMASLFEAPVPTGMIGFSAGEKYGSEKVRDLYSSQDAQGIWNRLKNESEQGLGADSMKSIADRYQGTQAQERARIAKAGMKGQAALRAQSDIESQKRQEAAALSATMKRQAFNNMRDEWGRRSLMALNYPIAYGQLGSSAMLGQTMQNLATQPLNTGAYL